MENIASCVAMKSNDVVSFFIYSDTVFSKRIKYVIGDYATWCSRTCMYLKLINEVKLFIQWYDEEWDEVAVVVEDLMDSSIVLRIGLPVLLIQRLIET